MFKRKKLRHFESLSTLDRKRDTSTNIIVIYITCSFSEVELKGRVEPAQHRNVAFENIYPEGAIT